MVERRSNLHSRRLDDELEHEVASLTHGEPTEARIEEGRLMEDSGDEDPLVEPILSTGEEGSPALSHAETRQRSELARHLRGSIFPADADAVRACAIEEHAPPSLVAALQALPDGQYLNVEGVWEALGGRRDERSFEGDVEDSAGAAAPRVLRTGATPEAEDRLAPPVASEAFQRFDFRFDPMYRAAAFPFLVSDANTWVLVDRTQDRDVLIARYGLWCVATPLSNVVDATITGPYAWWKTVGPPHLSLVDRGLTFASNRERGVCIRFREPVRGIDALGLIRHPALTVTVDRPDDLRDLLRNVVDARR